MSEVSELDPSAVGIGAVERDTGLSKDTLRIWERRYGFPSPLRDRHGERVYPREQVDRLRLVRKLLDCGYRPGKIIRASREELETLAAGCGPAASEAADERLGALLGTIRSHDAEALRQELAQALMRQGLARFITDTVAPLTRMVGEAWMAGRIAVFEEHLYTEQVQGLLRAAMGGLPSRAGRPRVLLTSLPNEPHSIGLLMVESFLALEGAACIALGTQTPAPDIARAAEAHRADIVALSFSAAFSPSLAASALHGLRTMIPWAVELWAGGAAVARIRRPITGVRLIAGLEDIPTALAHWRDRIAAG